ncbi:MAG: ATP synthase F1 subunit epsilon [Cytophagaceae bacterium]|nr:ATP synthase F1 subunit epsilon [Cytophagaceae bacterium]
MHLEIITPDEKVFSGEVTAVNVPGADGAFEVLNNHAPIISTLAKGNVKVKSAGTEKNIMIDGGLVEVLNNKIIVLAEAVLS